MTQQGVRVRCEVARRDNNTTRLSFEQGVEQQGVRAMQQGAKTRHMSSKAQEQTRHDSSKAQEQAR